MPSILEGLDLAVDAPGSPAFRGFKKGENEPSGRGPVPPPGQEIDVEVGGAAGFLRGLEKGTFYGPTNEIPASGVVAAPQEVICDTGDDFPQDNGPLCPRVEQVSEATGEISDHLPSGNGNKAAFRLPEGVVAREEVRKRTAVRK